jgi:GntR family transcriptional regulator
VDPLGEFAQPKYVLVAQALNERISAGTLTPGARLPGERDLCRRFGVSRATVRRALIELRAQSLIEPAEARGWFVTGNFVGEPNALQSFTEMALARGLVPSSKVVAAEARPISLEEAELFGAPPRVRIFELERVRLLNAIPIGLEHARLALWLAPSLTEVDFTRSSLYEALRACGIEPTRSDYELRAVAAEPRHVSLLEVGVGEPLQLARATTYDREGRVIELNLNLYRGDSYLFRTTLLRRGVAPARA